MDINYLLSTLTGIFTQPVETFKRIKEKTNYLMVMVLLLIVNGVMGLYDYLDGSFVKRMFETNIKFDPSFTMVQAESQATVIMLVTVIMIPISLLVIGFIYHIACMLQSKSGYTKTLAVVVNANLIMLLMTVITFIINKLTGTVIVFNMSMFLDLTSMNNYLAVLIGYFDLFKIWHICILFIGFRTLHDMTKKEAAFAASIPILLIFILELLLSNFNL